MGDQHAEDDIDLETLQAQIDLSLAHTKDLVSSWLKPTYGNASSSKSRANADKEVEELLRRPPRLGVGAPIPSSTGTLGHESVKLKNKLAGKKRPREEETSRVHDYEEDEEESRGSAIKKKTKVDPFAMGGKKTKKKSSSDTVDAANTLRTVAESTGRVSAVDIEQTSEKVPAVTSSTQTAGSLVLSQGKKKKKKKKKHLVSTEDDIKSSHAEQKVVENSSAQASPDATSVLQGSSDKAAIGLKMPYEGMLNNLPLLNLDGPPPDITPDALPSSKKKRRKRKRNKKKMVEDMSGPVHSDGKEMD